MDEAKDVIRARLGLVKGFLAQETPPKLSESDTKANFIEPIITALGWEGIGVVTREYYVRNSQEFIDYVMAGPSGLLLAMEAKPLQTALTDKHAAQLIQYCAVEGIEWAALTNGRELQFFNSFLKPDLAAKRVLRLDLLAFNSDAEFDALFSQVWQLSRESMTTPSGVRTWLNQRRLDAALRGTLLDSSSPVIRQLRKVLADAEISATNQDVTQWLRSHLSPQITSISQQYPKEVEKNAQRDRNDGQSYGEPKPPLQGSDISSSSAQSVGRAGIAAKQSRLFQVLQKGIESRMPDVVWRATNYYVAAETEGRTFLAVRVRQYRLILGLTLPASNSSPRAAENKGEFNWTRMTKVVPINAETAIDDELLDLIQTARTHSLDVSQPKTHYGISLRDLIQKGFLRSGAELVLVGQGGHEVAHAHLNLAGEIVWNGRVYRSPSDKAFASLLGRQSLNGWSHWHVSLQEGKTSLGAIRERFQNADAPFEHLESPAVS